MIGIYQFVLFFFIFISSSSVLAVPLNNTHWLLNCENGIKTCNASDPTLTIATDSVNISDCYFINCPTIFVTNVEVYVRNVTFDSSYGGAFMITNALAVFTDVTFAHCTADSGGAINSQGSNLMLTNVHFYQNQAVSSNGGGIYGSGQTHITCLNCTFLENHAVATGAAFLLTGASTIDWNVGYIENQSAGEYAAGFYLGAGSNGNITNVSFKNLAAASGTVVFLIERNRLTMSDIIVQNVSASSQGGFVYMWDTNILWCYRCNMTNLRADWIGGVAVPQKNSEIHFYASHISNVRTASFGAFYIPGGVGSLNNGTVLEDTRANAAGGSIALNSGSNFTCSNSIIRGGFANDGGCFDVGVTDQVLLDNCAVSDCHAVGNGGVVRTSGVFTVSGNTTMSDASAAYGGIIFATGYSTTTLEDELKTWNSSATTCGGAIYSDGGATINFEGSDWQIETANKSAPDGEFLCYKQVNMDLLQFHGVDSNQILSATGSIWIEEVGAGARFIERNLTSMFAPGTEFHGSSSKIAWKVKPVLPSRGLRPGEVLPPFVVGVTDRFGQVPPFSYQRIAVAKVVVDNATLVGEITKACLDFETGDIRFENIMLMNVSPGWYYLSVVPIAGTLNALPNDTFPSLNIRIAVCNTNERFSQSENQCLPTKEISIITRVLFCVLGAILFVTTLVCSVGIYAFRNYKLVRGSAPLFLWIMNAGVLGMSIALIVGVLKDNDGCIVRAWFEHLGFLTIFVPLLLKTRRIQFIFQREFAETKKRPSRLSNNHLLKNLGLCALLAITAMILWTVLDQPRIESAYYNNYVAVGRCKTTQGDLIAICIEIIVLIYSVQLAFSVRDTPANFNESKVIVFATYNWAVFIGIGSAVAEFAITDPQVSFIISSISIFIPSLVHTLSMTGYKVYLCLIDPDANNVAPNAYGGPTENSKGNKSKSTSSLVEMPRTEPSVLPTPRSDQRPAMFDAEASPLKTPKPVDDDSGARQETGP